MRTVWTVLLALFVIPSQAWAAATELTWFGHAAFELKTPKGNTILIDPWLTNPANPKGKDQLAKLTKAELILVSHGHSDHVGDAVDIAKKTGAKLVGTFDLGSALKAYAGFPAKQADVDSLGNFGGEIDLLDGEVTVRFVPAIHGSTFSPQGKTQELHAAGNPAGFVITIANGPTLYHTGDTAYFSDMELTGQTNKIDFMLAPIGGHFTMGPADAAKAAKAVNPANIVPMHYGTFPLLKGTPEQLEQALKKEGSKAKIRTLKIGQTIQIDSGHKGA